jgi:hypothetical protein
MGKGRAAMLALVLLVSSCATASKSVPKGQAHAVDYAPLRVGASWTYEMQYPGQVGEMTVRLVGLQEGFVVDDKNGAFRHTSEGLRDRDRYLLRHPLAPGTTWKTVVGPSAVEHAEIVSVGDPCESAAGRFSDCILVHGWIRRDEKLTLHIEWTWARDVGLVKVETIAEIAGQGRVPQTKQTLKSYALNASSNGDAKGDDGAPDRWESE